MSAAIPFIAMGVQAAGQYFAGRSAENAAKTAAGQQVSSVQPALALQQPYLQAGGQAVNTLSGLMGFQPTAPAPLAGSEAAIPGQLTAGEVPAFSRDRGGLPIEGKAVPRGAEREGPGGNTLANIAAQTRTQSGYGQGRMARVKAPDGRVVLVPQEKLAEAQAQGGQVVA